MDDNLIVTHRFPGLLLTPGSVQEALIIDIKESTNKYAKSMGMTGWMFSQMKGQLNGQSKTGK